MNRVETTVEDRQKIVKSWLQYLKEDTEEDEVINEFSIQSLLANLSILDGSSPELDIEFAKLIEKAAVYTEWFVINTNNTWHWQADLITSAQWPFDSLPEHVKPILIKYYE